MTDWQQIVEEHSPLVWRLAFRVLGRQSDAADCYQTVFLNAFEASQRCQVTNWPGFLSRLTTARAVDLLRRRVRDRVETGEVDQLPQKAGSDPSESAENEELVAKLRQALTMISPEQSEVFVLRHFELLSNQQIAAQMGTSPNRVGVLLHRAREALQTLLEPVERADSR